MQMDASELDSCRSLVQILSPITSLKEQFANLKLSPEDRAAEFYAAVGKETHPVAKSLLEYDR